MARAFSAHPLLSSQGWHGGLQYCLIHRPLHTHLQGQYHNPKVPRALLAQRRDDLRCWESP